MRPPALRPMIGTWLCALAMGCTPPPERGEEQKVEAPSTTGEEVDSPRNEAHRAAFEALMPAAEKAFAAADPVGASAIGQGTLAPRPFDIGRRHEVHLAVEKALTEGRDIDERVLANEEVVMLRAVRFGLSRLNDDLGRQPVQRTDPNRVVASSLEFLAEVEHRLVSPAVDASFDELAPVVFANAKDFSDMRSLLAASAPSLDTAARGALALAERAQVVRATLPPSSADAALGQALDELAEAATSYAEKVRELPLAEEAIEWNAVGKSGKTGELERLPDRWGDQALARMLSVEERIETPPKDIVIGAAANLGRLASMRKDAGAESWTKTSSKVDAARCEAVLEELRNAAQGVEGFEVGALDCEAVTRRFAGTKLADAQLELYVADHALVEPTRREIRARQAPAIALLSGDLGPAAHLHVRRILMLTPMRRTEALALAFDEAEASLCRTASVMLTHGTVDGVIPNEFLQNECPARAPEDWLADAAGDPRGNLDGILLARLGDQPHEMVAMDQFWWVPIGVGPLLATPPGQHPDGDVATPEGLPPNWQVRVEGGPEAAGAPAD